MINRAELLTDLATAINELTKPRHEVSKYVVEVENAKRNRKRIRKRHEVRLPPLIGSLIQAIEPGSDGELLMAGSFESQPSADMTAIAVLAKIRRESNLWRQVLQIPRMPLYERLARLVSATFRDDTQLGELVDDARSWVSDARVATGIDAPPFTVDTPCPNCNRRHTIVGSLAAMTVRCTACKLAWTEHQLGIFERMVQANSLRTTEAVDGPCPVDPRCYRRGDHAEHWDGTGHTWRDHHAV